MSYESIFLILLLITILIETSVLLLLLKIFYSKIKPSDVIFTGILTSALTLPYLWFIFPAFINAAYYLLIGESLVVLVEGYLIMKLIKLPFKNALIFSLLANTASFLIGKILLSFVN